MKCLVDAQKVMERATASAIALVALGVEDNRLSDVGNQLAWFNGFVSAAMSFGVISDVEAAELRKQVLRSLEKP